MLSELNKGQMFVFLEKGLNTCTLRQSAISNNISNVNTPNFKRTYVCFEDQLKRSLNDKRLTGMKTDKRHMTIGSPTWQQISPFSKSENDTAYRNDTNNVDIESEMADMAKNTVMYNALTKRIADEYSKIKMVMEKGGR